MELVPRVALNTCWTIECDEQPIMTWEMLRVDLCTFPEVRLVQMFVMIFSFLPKINL